MVRKSERTAKVNGMVRKSAWEDALEAKERSSDGRPDYRREAKESIPTLYKTVRYIWKK